MQDGSAKRASTIFEHGAGYWRQSLRIVRQQGWLVWFFGGFTGHAFHINRSPVETVGIIYTFPSRRLNDTA